ncbi:MAG: TfoX/Sxy family protein [Gemmatimonadetes bacterium]|nr:TfoX/Sxy family protein [Gemmatimonadota bacterium]
MSDNALAGRIRPLLSQLPGYSEKNMFGGVCFMINGNMCVGTWKGSLIVRLERENHEETLAEPHTRPADIAGRIMKGWALVEPAGIANEDDLAAWVARAADYAGSLPAK